MVSVTTMTSSTGLRPKRKLCSIVYLVTSWFGLITGRHFSSLAAWVHRRRLSPSSGLNIT